MEVKRTESATSFILNEKLSQPEIRRMVDLIEYQRVLDKSSATQEQMEDLLKNVKKGRWERLKKRLGHFE